MAASVTAPTQVNTGTAITPTGAGFADTTAYTVTASGPNTTQSDIKVTGTSSDGGAITPLLTITPNAPGNITITFKCSTDTIVSVVSVWQAE